MKTFPSWVQSYNTPSCSLLNPLKCLSPEPPVLVLLYLFYCLKSYEVIWPLVHVQVRSGYIHQYSKLTNWTNLLSYRSMESSFKTPSYIVSCIDPNLGLRHPLMCSLKEAVNE